MYYHKKHFSVKREELYERIWTQPVVQIAKEYGLSDVGLRKKCKKFKIPLPPLGYWAKKQFGKPIGERPPLPPYDGEKEIKFDFFEKPEQDNIEAAEPHVIEGLEKIKFEQLEENRIKVPELLNSPHPFIILTQEILNSPKADSKKKCLDIYVGQNSINRALRLMDALLKALESRGFSVSIANEGAFRHEDYKTRVQMFEVSLGFCLKEQTTRKEKVFTKEELKERAKHPWLRDSIEYVWEHNGKFTLSISRWGLGLPDGARLNWSDSERIKIEDQLNKFIIGLLKSAIHIRSEQIKRQRAEQERIERERQRAEKERLRKEEEARVEELYNEVTDWHMAEYIRAYIKAVKDKHGEITPGSELEKWTTWASKQADRLDSLAKRLSKYGDKKD
ncbi:hypothetical protein BAC3_01858 [uncultured bacterium]|nr:hypothetical protein BAC3_01858 [uncultured bacterium]